MRVEYCVLVGNGNKVLVVRFSKLHHQVLHSRRNVIRVPLATFDRSALREGHETSYRGLWRENRSIFDNTAVLEDTATTLEGQSRC